jgi:hypothetical protein
MLWSAVAFEGITAAVTVQALESMPPLTAPQLPSNTQESVTADSHRILLMQASPRYGLLKIPCPSPRCLWPPGERTRLLERPEIHGCHRPSPCPVRPASFF